MLSIHIAFKILAVALLFGAIAAALNKKPNHTYNASFGRATDYLGYFNRGLSVTGLLSTSKILAHENLACWGATGSGKTISIIYSSIISLARGYSSIIINDVSGEVEKAVRGHLEKKGYLIWRINFAEPYQSECFNVLDFCKTQSDIQKMALLIIKNTTGDSKSDPYWENSAHLILCILMEYVATYAEPQYRNMQNVLAILERLAYDGSSVNKLFAKVDPQLLSSFKAAICVGEKTLQSSLSVLRTCLMAWTNNNVCITTNKNTIDLNLLRGERPVCIFLSTPLVDLNYLKPICALLIQTLFNHVLSKVPEKSSRSIFFILEEFSSFHFPGFINVINNNRKYSCGLLICAQHEAALSKYGADSQQISANCAVKVFLKGQSHDSAKILSSILGRRTLITPKGEKVRELMTSDEIRMSEKAIVLIKNKPPLRCKIVPWFDNIFIKHLMYLPYTETRKEYKQPEIMKFS